MYERGKELGYGDATAANALAAFAPTPGIDDQVAYQPVGDDEEFLFGPTDRPGEPITAGAPFGAGRDFSKLMNETPNQRLRRFAEQATADPAAPAKVKEFLQRVARGE